MRIYLARLFLPFLTVLLIALPSHAYASTTDLTVIGVTGGTIAAATPLGFPANAVAGGAVFVGMAIGYWSLCPIINGIVAIAGGENPCVQVPSGTSAQPSAPAAPSTVAQTAGGSGYKTDSTRWGYWASSYTSPYQDLDGLAVCNYGAAADAAERASLGITWHWVITSFNTSNRSCYGHASNESVTPYYLVQLQTVTIPATCPDGYSVSGSTCVLSDAYAVASNASYKPHDYTRTGEALTVHLTPLNTTTPLNDYVATTNTTNDTVRVSGLSLSGNVLVGEVVQEAGGGATATFQSNTSAGTFSETIVVTDSSGVVVSQVDHTCSGQASVDANGAAVMGDCSSPLSTTDAASGVTGTKELGDVSGNIPGAAFAGASSVQSSYDSLAGAAAGVQSGLASDVSTTFNQAWAWYWPSGGGVSACADIWGASGVGSVTAMGGATYELYDICGNSYIAHLPEALDWAAGLATAIFVYQTAFSRGD